MHTVLLFFFRQKKTNGNIYLLQMSDYFSQ